MKMQNVECRMQNEEGIPEIFRNRCHIRSGIQQVSGAKGWRVYDSSDSYRSYDTNSERGSGISGISGEKSHPSLRSFRLHRISARQNDATGPFCCRNRGKYVPHKICSVRIPFECGVALTPTLSHPMGEGEVVHALGEDVAGLFDRVAVGRGRPAVQFRPLLRGRGRRSAAAQRPYLEPIISDYK